MLADLHIHSANSDGTDSTDDILTFVENALPKEEKFISFADHHHFTQLKVARRKNITVIPCTEVSVLIKDGVSCHLVVYSIQPVITSELSKLFGQIVAGYQKRAEMIHKKLTEQGMNPPKLALIRDPNLPAPVYTYDFARFIKDKIGLKTDKDAIFWARNNGNLLFVEEENFLPEVQDCIAILKDANLKVFWAHPGTRYLRETDNPKDFDTVFNILLEAGIDGVEVFYPKHGDGQTKKLLKFSKQNNLMVSGGSDYHGMGRGVGSPEFLLQGDCLKDFLSKFGY